MKILYLTTFIPKNRKSGGEIASQAFIDALERGGHEVLILGYQKKDEVLTPSPNEIVLGQRYMFTKTSKVYPIFWMALSLIFNFPYSSGKYYSTNFIKKVETVLKDNNYEAVIIDHAQLGWLEPSIKGQEKLIILLHNIEHEIYASHLKNRHLNPIARWLYKREFRLVKNMENDLAAKAQQVWTLTNSDASYFSSINKEGKVIAFAVPSPATISDTIAVKNCDIALIGSWAWKANLEGLNWFLENVYPLLPEKISIRVAGIGANWLSGRYANVEYCGVVPSSQEFMKQAKVVAIASISGTGVQIKTLDAIASGSLIVATPVAMREISEYPDSIRVAEQPEEFARNLIELLNLPTDPNSYYQGIAWSQSRQEKFAAEVAEAIADLKK